MASAANILRSDLAITYNTPNRHVRRFIMIRIFQDTNLESEVDLSSSQILRKIERHAPNYVPFSSMLLQ
jgi:hypothetical protein